MNLETERLRVALDDSFAMRLQPSELDSVASGLGEFDSSAEGNLLTIVAAVASLPPNDRAPLWELAVRCLGRHKPLEQAAGEIGMDAVRGRELLAAFEQALASVPPPESAPAL